MRLLNKTKFLSLVAFMGATFLICWLFARYPQSVPSVYGQWKTFEDSALGISFQYPAEWSVVSEGSHILRVSPPRAEQVKPDWEVGFPKYGIRIMPLGNYYASFPRIITEEDVKNKLENFRSMYFRTAELQLSHNETALLVYDVGHKDDSILALKTIKGKTMQFEMGKNFLGDRKPSEMIAFFNILTTAEF